MISDFKKKKTYLSTWHCINKKYCHLAAAQRIRKSMSRMVGFSQNMGKTRFMYRHLGASSVAPSVPQRNGLIN